LSVDLHRRRTVIVRMTEDGGVKVFACRRGKNDKPDPGYHVFGGFGSTWPEGLALSPALR
jgi:hypothetical protein